MNHMNHDNRVDDKLLWAFAVDATKPLEVSKLRSTRASRPKRYLSRYQVTACSPRLKAIGVRAGMSYDQARKLAPNMQIFVYNR